MKILAISGSARAASSNTALLLGIKELAPVGIELVVFHNLSALPIFSPDFEHEALPPVVQEFIDLVSACDGMIISSPEYVRAIPGGLKNAIDWLVSRFDMIDKPIALVHASQRGDDMLQSLRLVLSTVSRDFLPQQFLRIPLLGKSPSEIGTLLRSPLHQSQLESFLRVSPPRCNCVATARPATQCASLPAAKAEAAKKSCLIADNRYQVFFNHGTSERTMALINPHINFNGNAEEAFNFYKSVFGGEFAKIMRFKDLSSADFPVQESEANKIMHIALPIGNNVLMANDVPASMGRTNENENRSKISVSAQSKAEADTLFHGLSAGGQIEFPLGDSPWGSYFGMFRDKFGIEWMVDFDPNYQGKI